MTHPHAAAFRKQLRLLRRMHAQIVRAIEHTETLKSAAELQAKLAKKEAAPRVARGEFPQANGYLSAQSR